MTEQRHLIWSNYDLDYEDWRDDLEEDHPELTEDERMALMYEINNRYLDDERVNLNIQLDQPILVIADLGLWNGRRTGYQEISSGNIRDAFTVAGILNTPHGMWISWATCAATPYTTTVRTIFFTAHISPERGTHKLTC